MARGRYKVNLNAHMAECDANYVRLHRLLPELFDLDLRSMRLPLPGDDDRTLLFRVTERCPYTSTVAVQFEAGEGPWHEMLPAPRLTVRLYHDAQTAEVTAYQGQDRFHGRYEYPNVEMRQPDEKAQLNRFLGEYLALCLSHGREAVPVAVGDD
ncbi:MAG TPA: DUF1249 domain-containing protein [Pseudomonadales bacterium]|nr:DUF1249 domain-containing protein [Pseudomonadales bacterium]